MRIDELNWFDVESYLEKDDSIMNELFNAALQDVLYLLRFDK
jgi:hypothetical protein